MTAKLKMSEAVKNTLEEERELLELYNEIIKKFNVDEIDKLVLAYQEEVKASKGQLTNDRIRHYMGMFSFYSYALNANLGKQALRSNIAELLEEEKSSRAYLNMGGADDRKYTREERQARAKLESLDEAKTKILFESIKRGVESRVWSLNRLIDTLGTLSAINMSEAKLGGK